MRTRIAYEGDPLLSAESDAEEPGAVDCLVWGVDLSPAPNIRAAKALMQGAARSAMEDARRRPRPRHLVLLHSGNPSDRMRSYAHRVARALHAELERSTGRYVDVVAIDVTGLQDAELLDDRLRELMAQDAGPAGAAAISWEDLLRSSIHEACGDEYL